MFRNVLRVLVNQNKGADNYILYVLDLLWKNIIVSTEDLFSDVQTHITAKVTTYREDYKDKKGLLDLFNKNLKQELNEVN